MSLSLKIFTCVAGVTSFAYARVLEGERVTVGRSEECTLSLDDPKKRLSRVQAELVRTGEGYLLKVASKSSPVLVNGQAHAPGSEVLVRAGDSLTMDIYVLEIVSVAEADTDPEATMVAPAPLRPAAAATSQTMDPGDTGAAVQLIVHGRRISLGTGRAKLFGIGAVAIAGVLVLALVWPTLKGLLPDREAQKKAEQKIALLDGEARLLIKLLEGDRRELREAVAGSNRDVERIAAQLRSARSSQERANLGATLREARRTATVNTLLENKLRDQADGPDGLPNAEGNLNAAATAVKGADRAEAIRLLEETVGALTRTRSSIAAERQAAQAEQQRRQEELQIAEARAKAEGEVRAKAEAETRARAQAEARARAEADAKARTQAEARSRVLLEARARAEGEARSRAESEAKARATGAQVARGTQGAASGCLGRLSGSWTHPVGGTWTFVGNQATMVLNSSNYGPRAQQITVLSLSSCENDTMTYKIVRAALINTVDPSFAYDKTPANAPTLPNWVKVNTQAYSISGNGLRFGNYTYMRR